jgi:hypothetical protein
VALLGTYRLRTTVIQDRSSPSVETVKRPGMARNPGNRVIAEARDPVRGQPMGAREGPPEKERPGVAVVARSNQKSAGAPPTTTDPRRSGRLRGADTVSRLRRRRCASWRLPSLDCGCRDPWPCCCTDPPLTERQLGGWRDTARHLLHSGRIPLLPLEVRRALWRNGGSDRALAQLLADASSGEAVA